MARGINAMGRAYSNRNLAGPNYQFDNRITNGLQSPLGQAVGNAQRIIPFPGLEGGSSAATGQRALTVMAVLIVGLAAFHVWTHGYQQ